MSEDRTFINFKKADWTRFRDLCVAEFSQLPTSENTYVGEKSFSDITLQAAKRCIPVIAKIRSNFLREAFQLAEQRDALRRQIPAVPGWKAMGMEIGALANAYCRERWHQHLKQAFRGFENIWTTLRNLTNPRRSEKLILTFENAYTPLDPIKCCAALNRQLVEHPIILERNSPNAALKSHQRIRLFTPDDVSVVIMSAKNSTALGLLLMWH